MQGTVVLPPHPTVPSIKRQFYVRPVGPNTGLYSLPVAFPEPGMTTTPRQYGAPPVVKLGMWSGPQFDPVGQQDRADKAVDCGGNVQQLQLPPETRLEILDILGLGRRADASKMTAEQRKMLAAVRATDKFFYRRTSPLRPTAFEIKQSQLHKLFHDAIAYERDICQCDDNKQRHKSYLTIVILRIHLEHAADLADLQELASQALRLMTGVRELQFVIKDTQLDPRFLSHIITWLEVSGTICQIKKIRFDDLRRSYGLVLHEISPWTDTIPFVLELQRFTALTVISIMSEGLAFPTPMPLYDAVTELLSDINTRSLVIQILEAVFVKELLWACPDLKRVYLHSLADTALFRSSGFWTMRSTGNTGIPFCLNPSVTMSVRAMDDAISQVRDLDYDLFRPLLGVQQVDDTADSIADNDFNALLKQPGA
ncbi:hypothetical protein EIP86_005230, partial [Pleurotus ostreatoroseus]